MNPIKIGQYTVYKYNNREIIWTIHCNKCGYSMAWKTQTDGTVKKVNPGISHNHNHPHLEEVIKYCKVFL